MNTWILALVILAAWVLASIPFGLLVVRWLFRPTRRERAIDRAVNDPKFWEHAEAELRRQP